MYGEGTPGTDGSNTGQGGAYAGAGIAALQLVASIYNNERTNKANRELAQYSYSQEQAMKTAENTYNSPQMQMRRFEEAGLNPNLIYGQGNAGNQQGIAKYQAPRMEYNYQLPADTVPSMIMQFQDMKIKQAQYDNLKETNRAIRENVTNKEYVNEFLTRSMENRLEKTGFDKDKAHWAELLEGVKYGTQFGTQDYQIDYIKGKNQLQNAQIQSVLQGTKKLTQDTEYRRLQNEWFESKMIADFGQAIFGGLGKLGSLFRGSRKAAKTYQAPGRSLNQRSRDFDQTTRRMKDFGKRQGY